MKKTRFIYLFLFTALVGCASSPSADEQGGEESAAAEESEGGGEDALSDEPLGEGEETAGGGEAANGGGEAAPETETEKSLFDRIGGKGKLQMFADKFVASLAASPDLQKNGVLANAMKADQTRHKQMLVDFFCANSGGPCNYGGKQMKEAHAPLKITKDDWNVMRKLFIRTLREMKVPKKERMDLALIAARQKKHIVAQ